MMQQTSKSLDAALRAERKESSALRSLNKLVLNVVQSSGLFAGYLSTGAVDKERLDKAFAFFDEAKQNLGQLRKSIPPEDEHGQRNLDKLQSQVFTAMDKVGENCKKATSDQSANPMVMLYRSKPLMKQAAEVNDLSRALLLASEEKRDRLVRKQNEELHTLQLMTQTALAFNVLTAIAALVLFRHSLLSRLEILIAKSKRLSEQEPLGKPLGGADEFSSIDKVLHEAAASIQDAEKFRSQVISMVAHDMRSPLSSAMATVEIIEAEIYGEISDDNKKQLATLSNTLRRQVDMIGAFLDADKLSKKQLRLEYSLVETKDIIDHAVDSLSSLAEIRNLQIDVPAQSISLTADRDRLVQVLINLLSNAIKFSPAHSRIKITVEEDEGHVVFSISDQGKGIPEDLRKELFKAYSPSQKSETGIKGSGLGLFLSKWFVEAHGGAIGADANEGAPGTTFWFSVPKNSENRS